MGGRGKEKPQGGGAYLLETPIETQGFPSSSDHDFGMTRCTRNEASSAE